jgi:phosphoglycerol transferase MdoB-like AlkP superfamily enzyme
MKITGLYEYTLRSIYITYLKPEAKETDEDKTFLDNAYISTEEYKNKYTGIFEGKNLILIQLEGLDNWIVNKNNTPTIYKMLNNSINFTDHYSYYNGGGSTFNSEFAVNTGYITPLSYTQNAYTFNKNNFPNSLANIFKNKGYSVNAFHMNTGEFYSRTTNYKNWGYDNYYGLKDMFEYKDNSYMLDRELIENETFNKLMFPEEGNFVNYIITYSLHMPFTNTAEVCKELYELDNNPSDNVIKYMSELECIQRQAKETDYMIELLLKNLEEKNLIDDTVIVLFADHYLYTIQDQSILNIYKDTSNNLINKTPFFIWSNNKETKKVNEVTSQLNILPTLLNLFGLEYHPNYYIAADALNSNYEGIVFFSDYSWYNGRVYVDGGIVTNDKYIEPLELDDKNYYINYIIRKNDLTLKYNYFKTIKSKNDKNV